MRLVKKRNGNHQSFNQHKIHRLAKLACNGLHDVDATYIAEESIKQLYDGITTEEINQALILSARSKIEEEPEYSRVAARLLLNKIRKEAAVPDGANTFIYNIERLVNAKRLSKKLLSFDLDYLSNSIEAGRDDLLKYMGLQTLYDRYFIHIKKRRLETPQAFWMRVAMGLALGESDKNGAAIEFYNVMSKLLYCPGTPTLFNSGTLHPQLSSCYLSTVDDSIDGIFATLHGQARLSKFAGGLGVDVTPLRGTNAHISTTNGQSSGLIPWLKIYNNMLLACNQGGKRKGSGAFYLEPWHIDILDFLEIKNKAGDERRRCHDINTALWIPDEFMARVRADEDWYLFSPDEVPELHDVYGETFHERYNHYIRLALAGQIRYEVIKAKDLVKKMLTAYFETGHPWPCFKDPCNIRYMQKDEGVVHSSNLCTEVIRHTVASLYDAWGEKTRLGETAVCNIGSVNVSGHTTHNKINWDGLSATIKTAVRMLDNVIDSNYYPIREAHESNIKHRPIGLGCMGWSDLLHHMDIPYASEAAVKLAGKLQEFISFHAISNSIDLAEERGTFPSFSTSEWAKGLLPFDSLEKVKQEREGGDKNSSGAPFPSLCLSLPWEELRERLVKFGIRNSSLMCIAPTATISYITGCSQSCEPDYGVLFVQETLSGSFTMINEYFVKKAKKLGLWGTSLLNDLKRADGDVSKLDLPASLQQEFATAFNTPYQYIMRQTAARQVFVDMGISMNLYSDKVSLKYLYDMLFYSWELGLKTNYYLRGKAASGVEKSSVDNGPQVCRMEPGCQSCQ